MAAKPLRILLEVQLIDDSVCGRASTESGATREFAGWVGLLKVLEVLLPDPSPSREARELDVLGQRVRRGQVLGKLGNSGDTSAPHLHIHVMNGPSALGTDGLPLTIGHMSVAGHLDKARVVLDHRARRRLALRTADGPRRAHQPAPARPNHHRLP